MTAKEIREKETSHLRAELLDRQKHLYDLRSQAVTEKLEDPSQLRKTKKDIARIKTVLRQRELEEASKNGNGQKKESDAKRATSTTAATRKRPTRTASARPKKRTTTARSKKAAARAKRSEASNA